MTPIFSLLLLLACGDKDNGDGSTPGDGGTDDGGTDDGGTDDGGTSDGGSSDGGSTSDGGTDGGSTAPDCTIPDDAATAFELKQLALSDDMPTVADAEWVTTIDGPAQVWVWLDGTLTTMPADDKGGGEWIAQLRGLKASTTYEVQLAVQADDGWTCSEPASLSTGALASTLPTLKLETHDAAALSPGFMLTPMAVTTGGGGTGISILDRDGAFVWFYGGVNPLRTWLSLDGEAIVVNDHAFDPEVAGVISRIRFDGSTVSDVSVMGGHTDFVEVADQTYVTFGWDLQDFDGGSRTIAGETLIEVGPDGTVTELWNPFDDMNPDLDRTYTKSLACCPDAEIWLHLNHLAYDADDDAFIVSARTTQQIYKVDRSTGQLLWTLSQGGGDFDAVGDATITFNPHSATPTDDGILVFDTGSTASGDCSSLARFTLDEDNWTVEPSFLYSTEDCLYTNYMGNAVQADNGNMLLILAMNGQIDEVSPDGDLLWRLNLPYGWWLPYTVKVDSLFR